MREHYRKHPLFYLFIGLTLLALLVFSPYLLNIREFVFDTDQWIEYRFMYEQWDRMIDLFLDKGIMPFYSFNSFLGNDFFSSKAFYITGDFFFPIIRLFPNIVDGLKFETISCFVISGLSFALLCKEFGIQQNKFIILGAYIYALTGMASIFCGVYMFYRFYCFMPFIFYAIECYRNRHHYLIFPLSIAQAWFSCFYLMVPTSFFMPIYFFFTYYYHDDSMTIKKSLVNAIGAIFLYLIGFAVSGILLLPALINTLSNPRVANGYTKWYLPFDLHVFTSLISGLVTPSINVSSRIPYLFESGFDGHLSRFTTFVNPLLIISLLASIWIRKSSNRKIIVCRNTSIILLLVMIIKPINMLFHGLSEPSMRFIFVPLSILLLMALILFDNDWINNEKLINVSKIYIILTLILLVINIIIDQIDITSFIFNITLIIVSLYLLHILVKYYLNNGMNKLLIISLILINVISFEGRLLNMSSTYYSYTDSLNKEIIEYNARLDEDKFFRIWVDPSKLMPTSSMNLNQSMHFNYRSTASYDSCYEQNLNGFLAMNGIDWNRLLINDPQVLRMLGVKYWYVTDEAELPKEFNFDYVTNVNHYKVYQLNNYRPIGFTYSQFISNPSEMQNWNEQLLVEDELMNEIKDYPLSQSIDFNLVDYRNDNYLYGEINTSEPSVLFMSIPYNNGWMVLDGNEQIPIYKSQGGFLGLNLQSGQHYLTFIFIPPGYSIGNKLTRIGLLAYIILLIYESLTKRKKINKDKMPYQKQSVQ